MFFVAILFLIDRIASFWPLYDIYQSGFINKTELAENIIIGDYHSLLHTMVLCLIIFLLYMQYIMEAAEVQVVIRYRELKAYYRNNHAFVLCQALLFSVLHAVIECAVLLYADSFFIAIQHGYGEALLLQIGVETEYLFFIVLFEEVMEIYINGLLAKLVTMLVFSGIYFAVLIGAGQDYMAVAFLTPIASLCSGEYTMGYCLYGMLWLFACIVLLHAVLQKLSQKKEWL